MHFILTCLRAVTLPLPPLPQYVAVFWKTDHLRTRTEIHLLPVHDRHTYALSRNTMY